MNILIVLLGEMQLAQEATEMFMAFASLDCTAFQDFWRGLRRMAVSGEETDCKRAAEISRG